MSGNTIWTHVNVQFLFAKVSTGRVDTCLGLIVNETVLLRERKRHTDHSLSSTPYAVLSQRVPLMGGTLGRHPPGWGTPCPDLAGVPPILTWPGGYPGWAPPGQEVPQADAPWLGYPHPNLAGGGVPRAGAPLAGVTPILTWMGGCPR